MNGEAESGNRRAECVCCEIMAGRAPADIVYEDKQEPA